MPPPAAAAASRGFPVDCARRKQRTQLRPETGHKKWGKAPRWTPTQTGDTEGERQGGGELGPETRRARWIRANTLYAKTVSTEERTKEEAATETERQTKIDIVTQTDGQRARQESETESETKTETETETE